MKTIRQLLDEKKRAIVSVAPGDTVYDALVLLARENIGAVLVMDGDRLAGIFSERDYARKVILLGKSSKEICVREIMTENVICISPERTADEGLALMTDKRVRHLPVIESGNRIAGVVSIGDLVKEVISHQQFLIAQLEAYIAS